MQSQTKRLLLLFLMGTVITVAATAGGNQESDGEPQQEERQEGTPIQIEEGETVQPNGDEDTDAMEDSEDTREKSDQQVEIEQQLLDQPAWILFFHEDTESLQEEISVTMDRGYLPTAMEANPDGSYSIMYALSPDDTPDRWLMESYATDEEVNSQVSTRIVNGWNPLGFSIYEDALVLLYGRTETSIEDWRIHRSPLEGEEIAQTIENYQGDGYAFVDFGIDDADDQVWYLFVKHPGRAGGPEDRFFVNAYPNGESTPAGIREDYESSGGLPFAFASGTAVSVTAFLFTTDQ